jgi:hypothetical protein
VYVCECVSVQYVGVSEGEVGDRLDRESGGQCISYRCVGQIVSHAVVWWTDRAV